MWREEVGRRRDKLGKEKGKKGGRQKRKEKEGRDGESVFVSPLRRTRESTAPFFEMDQLNLSSLLLY